MALISLLRKSGQSQAPSFSEEDIGALERHLGLGRMRTWIKEHKDLRETSRERDSGNKKLQEGLYCRIIKERKEREVK